MKCQSSTDALINTHLKKGTIFKASFSAVLKPCEYNMTCAMSCLSGVVIAKLRNNFFKLSGRLERPAYPGFMVMKMAMSRLTFTCLPTSSIVMAVAEERIQITLSTVLFLLHLICFGYNIFRVRSWCLRG